MTKKFSLLKPEIREGYFRHTDRNEQYKVLHIPNEFWRENLENDIKSGAVQFKPCIDYLDGKRSRLVIIECDTKEEGLLAVTYLRGSREFDNPEDDNGYEMGDWIDYDNNLPIIDMEEIADYESNYSESGRDQFAFEVHKRKINDDPYWTDYYGDVCIVDKCLTDEKGNLALINHDRGVFGNPFGAEKNRWHNYFSRFMSDDDYTVYYILIREQGLKNLFKENKERRPEEIDEGYLNMFDANFDQDFSLCSLILKYTAEVVDMNVSSDKKESYYENIFKSWVRSYGLSFEKGFPIRKVLRNICLMENTPSQTMEKILKYIKYKYPDTKIISRTLFSQAGVLKNALENGSKTDDKNRIISMDDLVGMEDVKKQFADIIETIKFSRERKNKGLPVLDYRNVFLLIGAPGTAKTTMANILGRMMKKENLLKGTRFGSFSGAQLKAEYLGQTAHKVHEIFENHDILIIDEAYSLTASDMGGLDTYSQEALAQLAIELENHGTDRLIFFAGYGGSDVSKGNNKMKAFLDSNPGIKSRINGTIVFPSYDLDQMIQIVKGIAGRYGYEFEEGAVDLLGDYFSMRMKDEAFGNGREARSFVDNCQMTMASRIMHIPAGKKTKRMMQIITREDVQNTVDRLRQADENQLGKRVSYGFI